MDSEAGGAAEELRFTADHEWVRQVAPDRVRVGVTEYAAEQLGDVVFADLPAVGDRVTASQPMGEVESTKSVSEVFAPVGGTVEAVNDALEGAPELVNSAPFSDGWLVEIRVAEPAGLPDALAGMMDAAAYAASVRR